jgi:hypothetical protein
MVIGHIDVESGSFIVLSGGYRLTEHPQHEITLTYGDVTPTFQRRNVKWGLVHAAKHPKKG